MTVRNLDVLFRPQSIAVVGASLRPRSIGAMVWSQLSQSGFAGPLWPVNPKHERLGEHPAFYDVRDLPEAPSVAVLCTPPSTWPKIVERLGEGGTKAVVIVGAAGARQAEAPASRSRHDRDDWVARTLAAARPFLLRVVGPGSVGVLTPSIGACLGAPACSVKAGGVAWVSASNALTNGVLGWADARGLGFSRVVALGDEADVDAGDILDFLASDPGHARHPARDRIGPGGAQVHVGGAGGGAQQAGPRPAHRPGRPVRCALRRRFPARGPRAGGFARRPSRRNRDARRRPGRGGRSRDRHHERSGRGGARRRRVHRSRRESRAVAGPRA